MISIVGTPVEIDAPWLFEDSGINKINGKYIYSYCANWSDRNGATGDVPPTAVIAYMSSKNPLGPFKYEGYTLNNPGTYFGPWGNNHHWMFQFKNKWYIAFHGQTTEKVIEFEKGGYRSLFIDEMVVNKDGSLPIQKVSKAGCEKVANFNPYRLVPAATMHSSANVVVSSTQSLVPLKNDSWILIKNVDFSKDAKTLKISATKNSSGSLKFITDHVSNGTEIANVNINGEKNEFQISIPQAAKGIHNLYIKFNGTVELINWELN